jgi:hypothetical protein
MGIFSCDEHIPTEAELEAGRKRHRAEMKAENELMAKRSKKPPVEAPHVPWDDITAIAGWMQAAAEIQKATKGQMISAALLMAFQQIHGRSPGYEEGSAIVQSAVTLIAREGRREGE